jgi:hypothetical protein
MGMGMEIVPGDGGRFAIHEHTTAAEETMHSFKSVIIRHSEAMRRVRQLLEVVEQLRLGYQMTSSGPVKRGNDVIDEDRSYLQSEDHQVASNLQKLHYQRSLQASEEGGVESPFFFDGDVWRAQLYQLGYSMRSRAPDPYHTPHTVKQQPTHAYSQAQRYERIPHRSSEENGDEREDCADVRAASPRYQIADLQAQVEVLANRSHSLSARLLRGKNGRPSLASSFYVSHQASSGAHDSPDWQQAQQADVYIVGGADDMHMPPPPPPRIYESDRALDSVSTETETEIGTQGRRQRQGETWKVTAEVVNRVKGSAAHEGREIWSTNVTEREKLETARDLSEMSFQTYKHFHEMPSQSGPGPDLQSSARGGGGGGGRGGSGGGGGGGVRTTRIWGESQKQELDSAPASDDGAIEEGDMTAMSFASADDTRFLYMAHTRAQPPAHAHFRAHAHEHAHGPASGKLEKDHSEERDTHDRAWDMPRREDSKNENSNAAVGFKSDMSISESKSFTRSVSVCW